MVLINKTLCFCIKNYLKFKELLLILIFFNSNIDFFLNLYISRLMAEASSFINLIHFLICPLICLKFSYAKIQKY